MHKRITPNVFQMYFAVLPCYTLKQVSPLRRNLCLICTNGIKQKKRPVAVLGETRPVYPDKGCVGEVLGSEYLLSRFSQDGSMELMVIDATRH